MLKNKKIKQKLKKYFLGLVGILFFILMWEILAKSKNTAVFPDIKQIGKSLIQVFYSQDFFVHFKSSMKILFFGTMLADNRIYTLGYDDFDAIDEILKDIEDFDIPGFDADDLEMLYGDTTITETLEEYVPVGIEEKQEKQSQETIVPQNVVNQRAEVEQLAQEEPFVICHNCGAKVSIE